MGKYPRESRLTSWSRGSASSPPVLANPSNLVMKTQIAAAIAPIDAFSPGANELPSWIYRSGLDDQINQNQPFEWQPTISSNLFGSILNLCVL